MNLKNYTTRAPATESINKIKRLLIDFGASGIMEEYGASKNISGIAFILDINGYKLPFRLPAKVKETFTWLRKKYSSKSRNDQELLEQAERVCWKQMYEWVFIQLSLVELDQAEPLEVFFPYLFDKNKNETYYDKVVQNGLQKLLPTS